MLLDHLLADEADSTVPACWSFVQAILRERDMRNLFIETALNFTHI